MLHRREASETAARRSCGVREVLRWRMHQHRQHNLLPNLLRRVGLPVSRLPLRSGF